MGLAVTAVPNGLAVTQATSAGGLPVTVSTNGLGVTPVAAGGMPVSDTTGTLFGPAVIPANLTLPVISGTTTVGQTLTTSAGTWSGTLASYTYQWKRGGTNISGATGNTYLLVTADGGTNITCTVTATNTAGSASATSTAVGPITALVLPANTVLPVISGTAQVGSTLTTTNGTWTGTPTITYAYQWQRGGSNIGGATANTYALVTADLGATITVIVTASNAAGNTNATSAGVGPIAAAPTAPANTVLPAITGTTTVGQTLTTSNGTWTGTPTITYAYQWKRGGANISGATASTYVLVSADVGTTITATVTATNSVGNASATSAGVGPIAAGGYVGPGDLTPGAVIWCGLRAYNAAYAAPGNNPCIEITDSAGNNALTVNILSTGLLDYATLNAWIAAHGTPFVYRWYDLNGHNTPLYAPGAVSTRPTIVMSPPGLTAGRAAMRFVPADHSAFATSDTGVATTQPLTASVVCNRTAYTGGGARDGVFAGAGGVPRFAYEASTDKFAVYGGSDYPDFGTTANNTWYAVQLYLNDPNTVVNYTTVAGGTVITPPQPVGAGNFGGSLAVGGAGGEIITGYVTECGVWNGSVAAGMGANQIASL